MTVPCLLVQTGEARGELGRHHAPLALLALLLRAEAPHPLHHLLHLLELLDEAVDVTGGGAAAVGDAQAAAAVDELGAAAPAEIDVLNDDNAGSYWERSDLFDMALDLTAGRRGLAALGEAIARWVSHLLSVEVEVETLIEATDVSFTWYVGLDAEGTRIGDALWNGEDLDEATRARIVGLYRLTFRDPGVVLDKATGEPIYLILAMTPERTLRMKPQNLATGLPIARLEAVS